MKAKIKSVEFKKEYESKFGKLFLFKVTYDNKVGFYSSKSKEQTKFKANIETEFSEEIRINKNGEYTIIKPLQANYNNNYSRQVKKEQSRYSGFAMAYAKDLVVADKIAFDKMLNAAEKMFHFMVKLDKTLES